MAPAQTPPRRAGNGRSASAYQGGGDLLQEIVERLENIEEMLGDLVADGEPRYCPRETAASHDKNRRGTAELPPDHVICPGGYRLRRHAPQYRKQGEAGRDALYHPLPPNRWFYSDFPIGRAQVKSHNVWRSKSLTAAQAAAAGLVLRDDEEDAAAGYEDRRSPPPSAAPAPRAAPSPRADGGREFDPGRDVGDKLMEYAAARGWTDPGGGPMTEATALRLLGVPGWSGAIDLYESDRRAIAEALRTAVRNEGLGH